MIQRALGAVLVALLGAFAGAAGLIAAYSLSPGVVFEMDRDLPRLVSGLYPVERNGRDTFAWALSRARLSLPGASRRTSWTCSLRFRGGRPAGVAQPVVELAIDGTPRASRTATNTYEVLEAKAPPAPSAGLVLTIASSTTFVPSPDDRRELAIQVDSLTCRPDHTGVVLPPLGAIGKAALGAAVFGLALALVGVARSPACVAVLILGLVQALPLASGLAPFVRSGYPVAGLAGWIAILSVLIAHALEWRNGKPLQATARFALMFTAAALYLKLLALLHPSKPPVDVVFQAHRLEWVMSGRYFFTQPLASGVQFPYAIALYVFAAPWSLLTNDLVMLLRIVVCACEAASGAMLYVLLARLWNDGRAGAIAVVLFHLGPMAYSVIGNANLTNAFGQAASLFALAAATSWTFERRAIVRTIGLTLIVAVALLSHVSTFSQLSATLVILAALVWWVARPPARAAAASMLLATVAAAGLAIALYYGHFGAEYRHLLESRRAAAASGAVTGGQGTAGQAEPRPATPLPRRIVDAAELTAWSIGWPILLLGAIGAWCRWRDGLRDRLTLLVAALCLAFVVFAAVGILSPVNASLERYAAEFIGRVAYAVYPAAVILAGLGAAWTWRGGTALRIASAALVIAAVIVGGRGWLEWFL